MKMQVPIVPLSKLDSRRAAVHRAIAEGSRSSFFREIGVNDPNLGLPGPFNAMVRAPQVGGPLHRLGEALRYDGVLADLTRELCILRVALVVDSEFEWSSHEMLARRFGADDAMINNIRHGRLIHASPEVTLALRITESLVGGAPVLYSEIEGALRDHGVEWVVELTVLVHYYRLLGALMLVTGVE